jgi:hypothetical protein
MSGLLTLIPNEHNLMTQVGLAKIEDILGLKIKA